jgi:O-antigen ligase
MDHIAVMWETDQPFDIHMHSTFLQVLIGQGVLGYVLMCLCMWHAYSRFRAHYLAGTNAAPLYAAVVYMLFIWQIDIFMYGMEIGNALFFCVLAYFALDDRYVTRNQPMLGNQAMA